MKKVICLAFSFGVLTCVIGCLLGAVLYRQVKSSGCLQDEEYYPQYLSRNATYYSRTSFVDGYVETRDGKKTIKDIAWIGKPLGNDSLVCYSDGQKRGYFNMLTGEIAIKPQYKHAWIFSDGLASVVDNGMVKFIDTKGNVVIDLGIPYITGADGYVFHNGYCVMHSNRRDKVGLLNKQGKWILNADYDAICSVDSFFVVSKGGKQCVLSKELKPIIAFMEARFVVSSGSIVAEMKNHTLRRYSLQGELLDDFLISNIEELKCETDGENNTKDVTCNKYETVGGWFGLMSKNGKVITSPSFCDITPVGHDLYFCKRNDYVGELLNGRGVRVK